MKWLALWFRPRVHPIAKRIRNDLAKIARLQPKAYN